MDFRGDPDSREAPLVGWLSVVAGVIALVSHLLCCVMGGLSLVISATATATCILLGYVSYRRGKPGGDQQTLGIVGLVLGGLNTVVLLTWGLFQCGLFALFFGILAME